MVVTTVVVVGIVVVVVVLVEVVRRNSVVVVDGLATDRTIWSGSEASCGVSTAINITAATTAVVLILAVFDLGLVQRTTIPIGQHSISGPITHHE